MILVEAFHLQPHVTPETGPCQEKDPRSGSRGLPPGEEIRNRCVDLEAKL
jgi:hypothetical protein